MARPAYFTVSGYDALTAKNAVLKSDNGIDWSFEQEIDSYETTVMKTHEYDDLFNFLGTKGPTEKLLWSWGISWTGNMWSPYPSWQRTTAVDQGVYDIGFPKNAYIVVAGKGTGGNLTDTVLEKHYDTDATPSIACKGIAVGYVGDKSIKQRIVVVGSSDTDDTTISYSDEPDNFGNFNFTYTVSNGSKFSSTDLYGGLGVAYGKDNKGSPMFVAVGWNSADKYKNILRSYDGRVWWPSVSDGDSFSEYASTITYGMSGDGSPIWVAGGKHLTADSSMMRSKDGHTWEKIPFASEISTATFVPNFITCGMSSDQETMVWITGSGGTGNSVDNLLYSHDSVTWHKSSGTCLESVTGGCNWLGDNAYPNKGNMVRRAELEFFAGN